MQRHEADSTAVSATGKSRTAALPGLPGGEPPPGTAPVSGAAGTEAAGTGAAGRLVAETVPLPTFEPGATNADPAPAGGPEEAASTETPAEAEGGDRGDGPSAGPPRQRRRRRRRSVVGAVASVLVLILGALGLVIALSGTDDRRRTPSPSVAGPRPGPAATAAPGPADESAGPPPPAEGPAAPGVRWPTGTNANPPLDIWAWERWTGRPTDVAVVFTVRNSWQHIVHSDWPMADYPRSVYPGQLSIAQPLFPKAGDERTCARGHYDEYWAAFGNTLNRNGRSDAIVRLGWEYNGNWFWWYPRDTETWKTCFQRATTALRSTAPNVRIDFNVSAHRDRMPNGDGVWAAYPGDDYVDIVSSDVYDSYPPSKTPELFDQQCNVPSGTCTVLAFARAHGKQFAVPEWGLARADRSGGGDNPLFIEKMHDLFDANRDILAYEAYFNTAEATNVRSSLLNPQLHPNGARRYLELFGGGAAAGAGAAAGGV
ncbi:Glycosyl hydrolase family 26 [Frankia sp. EI5c]|uniref:glycoside hydrolase family 26 protein n=1 Tax=Frankia sp. EI5c TaxID=683316 RepID=UPI0007C323E4|nr:glycosyl hydrolase [Frankia sp. EI5c]OAA26896.1 Glycosyl hydrolase family 26 [Frankia sp. EI5c]